MEGQVAIVTGGAMGIGREYVEVLLEKGAKVCIADLNDEKGTETIKELQSKHAKCEVIFQKCDVTNNTHFEDVFKVVLAKFGRLDILINNAGILDESKQQLTIEINLLAVIKGTQLGMKYMNKHDGGHGGVIINISSIAGLYQFDIAPIYVATKHAVLGYSRSIGRMSLATHGVRVNTICPSFTDTTILQVTEDDLYEGTFDAFNTWFKDNFDKVVLRPATVAQCIIPLIEDTTLSGAAILSSTEHHKAFLTLPESLDDIHKFYVK